MIQEITEKLKRLLKLLLFNWQTLIGFEVLYKIIASAVLVPLTYSYIGFAMKLAGYSYVTGENAIKFITNPIVLVMLAILLLFMSFFAMIDISAIIYIVDQSDQERKVGLLQPTHYAFNRAIHAFEPKNIMMSVVVLIMIPYLNFGVLSNLIGTFSLPSFIQRYIDSKHSLSMLAIVATIVVAFYLLRWLFGFHYYSLEKCDFNEARRRSLKLIQHHWYIDALILVALQLVFWVMSKLVTGISYMALGVLQRLMNDHGIPVTVLLTIVLFVLVLGVTLISTIEVPISYATISAQFYYAKEACNEPIHYTGGQELKIKPETEAKIKKGIQIAFIIALVITVIYIMAYARGDYKIRVEDMSNMSVTAHRGASSDYPENTMSAFYGAKAQGANCLELDVEQSKDGVVFVCHDSNFKRLTGVDKDCWEMDYADIKKLNAGYRWGKAYADEYMPTLEEVIQFASYNNINLNIEIKPTGHETDIEQRVCDQIARSTIANRCVVTSQEYSVLETVKEINPNIKTAYVTSVAYGDFDKLEAADALSIEATTITTKLVKEIHREGKEVYAWTVNDADEIQAMIDYGVDDVITDDVLMAKEKIYKIESYNLINKYLNIFTRDNLFSR